MKSICSLLVLQVLILLLSSANSLSNDAVNNIDKRSNPVKRSTADCGDHEFFNSCGSTCERNCDDINNDDRFGERCTGKLDCVEKCVCKEGYVRENLDGKCIRIQECPRVKH